MNMQKRLCNRLSMEGKRPETKFVGPAPASKHFRPSVFACPGELRVLQNGLPQKQTPNLKGRVRGGFLCYFLLLRCSHLFGNHYQLICKYTPFLSDPCQNCRVGETYELATPKTSKQTSKQTVGWQPPIPNKLPRLVLTHCQVTS